MRAVLGGFVVAAKTSDDASWYNAEICAVFPYMTVAELNRLERFCLKAMDFDVNIKSKEYVIVAKCNRALIE